MKEDYWLHHNKGNRISNQKNPYGDLPIILDSLAELKIPTIIDHTLEADDVIAHLVLTSKTTKTFYIMSNDKDFLSTFERRCVYLKYNEENRRTIYFTGICIREIWYLS